MKKKDMQPDLFSFGEEPQPEEKKEVAAEENAPEVVTEALPPGGKKTAEKKFGRAAMQQAAFAFLSSLAPDGAAAHVAVCGSRKAVAAAGFWRGAKGKLHSTARKSAIVVLYEDPESCFLECADREKHQATLQKMKERQLELEAQIRREEPHLASHDDLFRDMPEWDYASSCNAEYHRLRRRQEREQRALCKGSAIERFSSAGAADLCYVAVPAGGIAPELLPGNWGLVEVFPEMPRFRLVREAQPLNNVTEEGRTALVFQIALASAGAVRFASGVESSGALRKMPRRRGFLE